MVVAGEVVLIGDAGEAVARSAASFAVTVIGVTTQALALTGVKLFIDALGA